ncbi:MAG: DUF1570 domain-containing protein [Terriglobales bacterium]
MRVTSPHFVVVSDGSVSQAREVAGQLERLRQVFQQTFPGLRLDELARIHVLAVRNFKEFREVEPAAYLAKGSAQLSGYFQRSPEGNFILLRLDANEGGGGFPNATVYHEYTHAVTTRSAAQLPPWLMEGLAEFYQTAQIGDREVELGLPDPQELDVLRTHNLLPMATLLAVDQRSPYYHEQNKIDIFYAESWALTHYLMERQGVAGRQELARYITLLQQHANPVAAGTAAFGDLNKLQRQLESYVHQERFKYTRLKLSTAVDEKSFAEAPAAPAQPDALKANLLANVGRLAEAATLARQVLRENPGNASACVTLGMVAYRRQDFAAAQHNYALAVQFGTTNYFALLRYAQLTLRQGSAALDAPTAASVAGALQQAIRLKPGDGAADDMLATLYSARGEQPAEVDRLQLEAISLDPSNFDFRYNRAVVLMNRQQQTPAMQVLNAARPYASSAEQLYLCDQALRQVRQNQLAMQKEQAYQQALAAAEAPAASPPPAASSARPPVSVTAVGTVVSAQCGTPRALAAHLSVFSLVLVLRQHARTATFSSPSFSWEGTGFTCATLKGKRVRLTAVGGQIVQLEFLH